MPLMRVCPEQVIALYNKKSGLVYVRFPFEMDRWGIKFSITVVWQNLKRNIGKLRKGFTSSCVES